MDNKQSEELTEFLMHELSIYGFGDIVNEINDQIKENFDELGFLEPKEMLLYILSETTRILNSFSNKNYNALLSRLNENIEGSIEEITVVWSNDSKDEAYNLRNLPDYTEISGIFEGILGEIANDNSRNNDNS